MERFMFAKILLIIGGVIGIGVGALQLLVPVAFEARAGISLGENSSLLSEIRASGGTLLLAGFVMVVGAFNSQLIFTSIVLSSLFYLSYGLSRIFSIVVDGIPGESLIMATVFELALGSASVFLLFKHRKALHETE